MPAKLHRENRDSAQGAERKMPAGAMMWRTLARKAVAVCVDLCKMERTRR